MDSDAFSYRLPLPYRLAATIIAGVWLWGLALQILRILPRLIGYPHTQQTHQSTYTFASFLTAPLVVSSLIYSSVVTHENYPSWRFLPNGTLLIVLLAFIPVHIKGVPLLRGGRTRFMSTLRRISIGGLADQTEPRFGDVLLADALTSYARVLSELYVAICMFLPRQHTPKDVERDYGATYMVPLLACYPFLIRFRQCLIARQPANAIKYSTAFFPIILGALMSQPQAVGIDSSHMRGWWMFTALLNSSYSLWWDVFCDWDLPLISAASHNKSQTKFFGLTARCYVIVILDTLLRFTWCLRLSLRLDVYEFQERTVWVLEMLEVCRRWMWLLFRAETEWLRKREESMDLSVLLE